MAALGASSLKTNDNDETWHHTRGTGVNVREGTGTSRAECPVRIKQIPKQSSSTLTKTLLSRRALQPKPSTSSSSSSLSAKWFNTTSLLLILASCVILKALLSGQQIVVVVGAQETLAPSANEQQEQQQHISVEQAGGSATSAQATSVIGADDAQQKLPLDDPQATDLGADSGSPKTSASETAPVEQNSGATADIIQQQASDSTAANVSPDLDSAAASMLQQQQSNNTDPVEGQQQQQQVQVQQEETPISVPVAQDVQDSAGVSQNQQPQQQQQTIQQAEDDGRYQQRTIDHNEQSARATNFDNDVPPETNQSGVGSSQFGKKQTGKRPQQQQESILSASEPNQTNGQAKASRSLKRAFSGHIGVFGRKRANQNNEQEITESNNNKRPESGKQQQNHRAINHHHHYYYQTVNQHHRQPNGAKQRPANKLKQVDYPDYKEILVQPDLVSGHDYEAQRHTETTSNNAKSTLQAPATIAIEQTTFQDQDRGQGETVTPTDTLAATTTTIQQQTEVTGPSNDQSGFDVQQQSETGGKEAPATTTTAGEMPYIRLSNIATINSTTTSNSSAAANLAAPGEMKLMRIYVIDLDQKLVVGGASGQTTTVQDVPAAATTTTTTSTSTTTTTTSKPVVMEHSESAHIEQSKVDGFDSTDQMQHPYNENLAYLMQTQQSSTVYATTSMPQGIGNHYQNGNPHVEDNGGSRVANNSTAAAAQTGSSYSNQQVVAAVQHYQQQPSRVVVGPSKLNEDHVYVDRNSLQANLSQIVAQMGHDAHLQQQAAAVANHQNAGHHYHHYPRQPAASNYPSASSNSGNQQAYNKPALATANNEPSQANSYEHQNLANNINQSNNGTTTTYNTNSGNQYLGPFGQHHQLGAGKSARATDLPPTFASTSMGSPAQDYDNGNQSLSVAYPSFMQQQQQQQQQHQQQQSSYNHQPHAQFAAVYPAPMQHHHHHQQEPQHQVVMSVPQYIAPQYNNSTAQHNAIVPNSSSSSSSGLVNIYKQQQQQQVAGPEQYSAVSEWPPAQATHQVVGPAELGLPPSPAYATNNDANNYTDNRPMAYVYSSLGQPGAVIGQVIVAGDHPTGQLDKYQPARGTNMSTSSSNLYAQQQQQQQPLDHSMYQQQQQQHPISPGYNTVPGRQQSGEPGQQRQYNELKSSPAEAASLPSYASSPSKVTTTPTAKLLLHQADHWKPVDFVSPVGPVPVGSSQSGQKSATQARLNGFGESDHDIVSLGSRQQHLPQPQPLPQYHNYSVPLVLQPTNSSAPGNYDGEHAQLNYLGGKASAVALPSGGYVNILPEHQQQHSSSGYENGSPNPRHHNSQHHQQQQQQSELAPSQQVHAHPSSDNYSQQQQQQHGQYNGTTQVVVVEYHQQQKPTTAGVQVGVTNEYAETNKFNLAKTRHYPNVNQKATSSDQSDESPKIPRTHSSGSGHRRPSDTVYMLQDSGVDSDESDEQSYSELSEHQKPATGAKTNQNKYNNSTRPAMKSKRLNQQKQKFPLKQGAVDQFDQQQQHYSTDTENQPQVGTDLTSSQIGHAHEVATAYALSGRQPARPQQQQQQHYLSESGAPYLMHMPRPNYGGAGPMMMRPPHQPQQQQQQQFAHYRPAGHGASPKGLLSWQTISSVASGAAKRLPGALSSILNPFGMGSTKNTPAYPTAQSATYLPNLPSNFAKGNGGAHLATAYQQPYPFRHMTPPETYSDAPATSGHAHHVDPQLDGHDATEASSSDEHSEQDATDEESADDLSSSSSSSASSAPKNHHQHHHHHHQQQQQQHRVPTVTVAVEDNGSDSHSVSAAAAAANLNSTNTTPKTTETVIVDLAEITPDGKSASKKRPQAKAKAAKSGKTSGELEPAHAVVLSSIEQQLEQQEHSHPQQPRPKRRKPSKKARGQQLNSAEQAAYVDPQIGQNGAPVSLESLPLDQQRLLLAKMPQSGGQPKPYGTPASGLMFGSNGVDSMGGGPAQPTSQMGTLGLRGSGGVQIGQYKIVPQTQFVQSIIEPSRQMLGQYFKQYIGQLGQFG